LVGEFHGVYQTHAELADSSNPTGFSVSVKRGVVMTDVFDQEGLPEHAMQIHRRNAYNCIIPFILENNAICNAVDDQHSTTWILLWPLSVSLDAICSARLPIPSPLKFTYGIEIGFLPPGRDEYSSGRRNRHPDVVAVGQDTRFCGRRLSLREIFFEEHSRF